MVHIDHVREFVRDDRYKHLIPRNAVSEAETVTDRDGMINQGHLVPIIGEELVGFLVEMVGTVEEYQVITRQFVITR